MKTGSSSSHFLLPTFISLVNFENRRVSEHSSRSLDTLVVKSYPWNSNSQNWCFRTLISSKTIVQSPTFIPYPTAFRLQLVAHIYQSWICLIYSMRASAFCSKAAALCSILLNFFCLVSFYWRYHFYAAICVYRRYTMIPILQYCRASEPMLSVRTLSLLLCSFFCCCCM